MTVTILCPWLQYSHESEIPALSLPAQIAEALLKFLSDKEARA